jgi:hypothetical protein
VPVLAKSSSPQRSAQNIHGMFQWKLSVHQKGQLDALDAGQRWACTPCISP